MTHITNAEYVLMLLRSHLERARKFERKQAPAREARAGSLQRLRELASAEGLSEADLARALIASLLGDEFGAELAVEPRFQAMVEDVRLAIERDDAAKALLQRAITQIRADPR